MILCEKHKISMVRQNSKHYYCTECDRLAVLEAKRIFGDNKYGCNNGKKKNKRFCATCGVEIYVRRKDKKYCTQCTQLKYRNKIKKLKGMKI